MLHALILGSVLTLAALQESDSEAGFVPLFDGKDLSQGIIPEGDNGHWKVLDSVLDYDARSAPPATRTSSASRSSRISSSGSSGGSRRPPYENPNIPYILPDGTHARDVHGEEFRFTLLDSDSEAYLRDLKGKSQVNIWCWPIGSGEVYDDRTDPSMPPEVRAGVTPRTQADKPVGKWNSFEITLMKDRLTIVLNGKTVIEEAMLPGSRRVSRLPCSTTAASRTATISPPPASCSSARSGSSRSRRQSRRSSSHPPRREVSSAEQAHFRTTPGRL